MKKFLSVAALMLSVMLVVSSSQAETNEYTDRYTTGGVAGAGANYPSGDPDIGTIGGGSFAGTEGTPASITVTDTAGQMVFVNIGQSTDGDQLVGEAGEPPITKCVASGVPVNLGAAAVPFVDGLGITVFVSSVGAATCPSVVTTGTITLTTTV